MKKIIATITTAALINAVVVIPVYANMIDDNQQKVTAAPQNTEYQKMQQQQAQQQQSLQTAQQQFNTANTNNNAEVRQTIYDATTGQMVTIVKNGYAISAYNSGGQQIPLQADWLTQVNQVGTANISGSSAQQLATIASTIQADANLNTVGKLIKALIALEAVKANNQLMRQQYARQLSQQKQPTPQQQTTTSQKKDSPASKRNTEKPEYGGALRDNANQTGGTVSSIKIGDVNPNENAISVDLVGKIANINGDILTLQDTTGRNINVKINDPENYSIGDNLNATGSVLAGSDGNIYVVNDQESGMDVKVDKISDASYEYKAQQQQQSTEEFVAQHPEAAGLSGTGAGGAYYQAPQNESSSASESVSTAQQETTIEEQPTESTQQEEQEGFWSKAGKATAAAGVAVAGIFGITVGIRKYGADNDEESESLSPVAEAASSVAGIFGFKTPGQVSLSEMMSEGLSISTPVAGIHMVQVEVVNELHDSTTKNDSQYQEQVSKFNSMNEEFEAAKARRQQQ